MARLHARDSALRFGGWSTAAVALALYGTVPWSLSGAVAARDGVVEADPHWEVGVIVACFAISGAALVHARPRNWIGWLLLASGVLQVANVAAAAYAARALTEPDRSLPRGVTAAWVASWTWVPSLLLPVLVLPALYPTGRPQTRFWRWHVRLALTGVGLAVAAMSLGEVGLADTVRGTRLPFTVPPWAVWATGAPAAALLLATTASVIVGTLVRALRARSPERQQLLWLLSVIAAMVATVFTEVELLFALSYGLVPVAVTIGVLRYRLLGIEVVLKRTLLYVPLTLLVALVVYALTTALALLVPHGPLPLLVASAAVAVMLIPAARRLNVLVDRLVRGERDDPLDLVHRVAADLEVEVTDPVASMLRAVASATGARHAVATDIHGRELARLGEPGKVILTVPLRHGGDRLGTLAIGPRGTAAKVSAEDERLVTVLAPHLAIVIRSALLADQLDRERHRVTAATLAERDRLRRDLHDGLGPSLSGIALGLEAAGTALSTDPTVLPALLSRTRAEAEAAAREVRRVLDGLRPGQLDLEGLEGAVRSTAASLGLGGPGGPRFDLQSGPLPLIPAAVEEAAFRIVAESLTNVARHAAAARCTVQIRESAGLLRIRVDDDGHWVSTPPAGGHGLGSMRQRAADLGGSLQVRPASPHGTRITAVLPLEHP